MRRTVKIIILLAVLMVPALFFVFLKKFGQNTYAIPVLHTQGVGITGCRTSGRPFVIPSGLRQRYGLALPAVFYFDDGLGFPAWREVRQQLAGFPHVQVYRLDYGGITNLATGRTFGWSMAEMEEFINCGLILGEDQRIREPVLFKMVFVDEQGRIRGYYNLKKASDRERLATELEIWHKFEAGDAAD